MYMYVDKPLSLIEKKKQQWAKEKEELAGLGTPWNTKEAKSFDRPFQRNRYGPKFSMANNEFFRKEYTTPGFRRSSLPPLYKNQYNSIDKDIAGGETSGYGSDNPNQPIPCYQSGYESSSSYKDDRPKWKDKTNKCWDSTNENDPPNWLKRGLQTDEEIIVSNTSPAESPEQEETGEQERPFTSSSSMMNRTTYIRGQNIPLDSAELAERERRRQVALAHQEAVRQQLEERERKRQQEREKRIQEELEEELRIEREQEIERQRRERELLLLDEKKERERKRNEALKEALEIAEKEAKLQKTKLKFTKQNNIDELDIEPQNIIHNNIEKENAEKNKKNVEIHNLTPAKVEPLHLEINNNLEVTGKSVGTPRLSEKPLTPRVIYNNENDNNNNKKNVSSFQILSTPRTEMTVVLQTPLDSHQNLQYAILVPNYHSSATADRATNTAPIENRTLTPTQYRNKNKLLCDSCTQTDSIDLSESNNQRYIREKLTNLELHYDNRSSRKDRRERSVEERPKWGANRPPTRYMKQSEKDPQYQRRKLRQKMRDYKNSSDESQTGSPRPYRKNSYVEKRHTRAMWRKNDHFFARNIRMYQTEIVPLESDKEQIYYARKCVCCCRCECDSKAEVLKVEQNSPRDRLPDFNENILGNSGHILDKLTSLHNGIMLKQEHWERSPRTPSLSSSTRNTENLS